MKKYGIAIHGGSGNISKKRMTPQKEANYRKVLEKSLLKGIEILKKGGKSLEAVAEAIIIMEDSPLFNAGKGAVFTNEEENEHDASIMDGHSLKAGAVGCSKHVKNPILLAKEILLHSKHIMLVGEGALSFAKERHLEIKDKSYFFDEYRYKQFLRARDKGLITLDNDDIDKDEDSKYGTVGAVALDKHGNLCAGTSTGGIVNKKSGRVGDSALIGSGTYANNETCAISCTGKGEYFIKNMISYDISARMMYLKQPLDEACELLIQKKLKKLKGRGGLIAIDKDCNISTPFNTKGMYRGFFNYKGDSSIDIF